MPGLRTFLLHFVSWRHIEAMQRNYIRLRDHESLSNSNTGLVKSGFERRDALQSCVIVVERHNVTLVLILGVT